MIHVTRHALNRALERIPGCDTEAKARVALTSDTIMRAVRVGAPFVKLGTGQHVVVRDGSVITVLPKDKWLGALETARDHQFREGEH